MQGTDTESEHSVKRTIGVVFPGTPFEGSSKVKWASRALQLLGCISATHKEDVKDLEERSAKLISTNDAFQKLLKARDRSEEQQYLEVACFFEQYATYKAGKKIGWIVPRNLPLCRAPIHDLLPLITSRCANSRTRIEKGTRASAAY